MEFRRSPKKRRLMIMSWLSALGSAAGNVFGSVASTGLQYYYNKDLIGYANDLNKDNLRNGPSIQREGLKAAGYNPLLAMSGYTSGLPSVSPMSVGHSDLSNLGSSAMSAYKMKSDSDLSRQQKKVAESDVDVKKAQAKDLDASKDLKDALKDKAEADATKSKVESIVEPVRALSAAGGSVATAYGAKKVYDALKKGSKLVDIPLKFKDAHLGSRVLQSLGIFGLPAIPAASAYQLNKYLYKVSPNARKIIDTPNLGSRLR